MDEEMLSLFYEIEYNEFEYGDRFHHSNKEKLLDRLLRYFENIAYLWKNKNITLDDIQIFRYDILRVYKNPSVRKYLEFVKSWSESQNIKSMPYNTFVELGIKLDKMNNI